MTEDFELSEGEKLHPLWARLKTYFTDRLRAARERNDHAQSEQETATVRGEIRCLKTLIRLGDDRPII